MSVIKLNTTTRLAIALLSLSLPTVQAEMSIGYIASEWNPATEEYKEVYKDWQEGVALNADTGNYIVTYRSSSGTFYETILEPATKIDPTLKSKFQLSDSGNTVIYRYKLRNRPTAKQDIRMFLTHVSNISGNPINPPNWDGRAFPTFTDSNLRLSWTYDDADKEGPLGGLAPGKSAGGFWIESNDLPGVAVMEIKGNVKKATTWLAHQPNIETPVGKRVLELEASNFIPRLAAVPRIVVPTPFDAAVVLSGIQKHIKQDLITMKLLDSALAAQLDQWLQAAIDAAKINNTTAVRASLKDLRKLLKKEHEDVDSEDDKDFHKDDEKEPKKSALIDKLAARVLDFDLKYVEKRVKGDKD